MAGDVANPSVAFIQRTMARMAASTPGPAGHGALQFYGQSITAQPWTKLVQQGLVRRFPSVKFTFSNPAIGGFTYPALIRTAEHDLYPWYPDILVFHVYGTEDKYEEIIRNVAGPDHGRDRSLDQPFERRGDAGRESRRGRADRGHPPDRRKYDCMLIDVRNKWIAYLQQHRLPPPACSATACI